jgi:hypothetical protein
MSPTLIVGHIFSRALPLEAWKNLPRHVLEDTFHWDDIRFSGPRLPMYDVYESPMVVDLAANGSRPIGASTTQVVTLPRVGREPVLFGQTHGGLRGQVLLRINGRPQLEVQPHSHSAKNNTCWFGTWRSFRVPLEPALLRIGDNTLEWTVGPRPACADGQ